MKNNVWELYAFSAKSENLQLRRHAPSQLHRRLKPHIGETKSDISEPSVSPSSLTVKIGFQIAKRKKKKKKKIDQFSEGVDNKLKAPRQGLLPGLNLSAGGPGARQGQYGAR